MEYGKKDWQRSEGRYRSLGKDSREKEKPLSAYHPAERENTRERRPNEMMTMESSYGGVALGASRSRKMTMVVHEKRRSRGPGLKKDNRELEGSRTASISELRGDFRTNSHSRRDSAFAYEEDLHESPLRMMEHLQEMMDENYQQSGQKVLPFINRKQDAADRKEIQEQLRASLEKGDSSGYQLWNQRQEAFLQERSEKEEMYRRFYRELQFTREKSKKLMQKEEVFSPNLMQAALQGMDGGTQEENPAENPAENPVENLAEHPEKHPKRKQKKKNLDED